LNELLIFAKAPRPGLVKTRLANSVGKEAACSAYKRLIRTLAARLEKLPGATVCYSPPDARDELSSFFPAQWRFAPQTGAELGERLYRAMEESFARGAAKVAVIGCDCPYITRLDIENAWSALDSNDAVLGPATDGGYWLVGSRELHAGLFEGIDWSTERVLSQTLEVAGRLKLRTALLRTLEDVDTELEWQRFLEAGLSAALHTR
jgi:rSAM/selenodomain-associated transferase 1